MFWRPPELIYGASGVRFRDLKGYFPSQRELFGTT